MQSSLLAGGSLGLGWVLGLLYLFLSMVEVCPIDNSRGRHCHCMSVDRRKYASLITAVQQKISLWLAVQLCLVYTSLMVWLSQLSFVSVAGVLVEQRDCTLLVESVELC